MTFGVLLRYHMAAFFAGFVLDLILGDPYSFPHPIRLIGNLIAALDKQLLKKGIMPAEKKRRRGLILIVFVCGATAIVASLVLVVGYRIHPIVGGIVEAIMSYQVLAMKCLKTESMKVYDRLKNGTIVEARKAVSMIVGRDTEHLNEIQVTKAAVETVAENASDGVIAPMIYTAIGGPALGMLYKSINTMDSMVGYKNDRYMDFGRYPAKLDDKANFLPSRICAWMMIAACLFLGKDFDAGHAKEIYLRDRFNHKSPNAAQTESVCAGAMNIQLAGSSMYFGKMVEKPFIGDAGREIEIEDIVRANRLLYGTGILCQIVCLIVLGLVTILV